jgi:L-asparaginase
MPKPNVLLVSLGGTITMTPGAGEGITPSLTASDLVAVVPELAEIATLETLSPLRLPGASLTLAQLGEVAALLNKKLDGAIDGAVVIQGTDTIEETAFVLDLLIASNKPVIVTGAMRGAKAPGADGPANLLASVITASTHAARGLGTLVVLNDEIHAARFVQKSHTALLSAFSSPSAGPLGLVIEGEACFHTKHARMKPIRNARPDSDQPVALVTTALGDDGRILSTLSELGYRGVVIEAMGAGHVPSVMVQKIVALLEHMPVILSVRVPAGPVFSRTYGFPGSETDILGRGVLSAGWLGGLKARLLLSLLLGAFDDRREVQRTFLEYSTSRFP